ncbi:DNA double-strand break repair nuclease NurA [Candidatus Woesearchaeota archaeon]|nr:DNA double-strand break repair nuclease NurA [Candidatus Woesearchaeota archaeon]
MYDKIIDKILKSLNWNLTAAAYPKFSGEGYVPYKLDKKNFHGIKKSISGKKIAFIDGGNAEIIGSANFSLNLIRICYAVHQNNKKIAIRKFEIFAFTEALNKDNEIHYATSFFNMKNPLEFHDVTFSSLDNTLMLGISRAGIAAATNAVRRFAELKLAKLVADEKISDIIVLDGSLQATLTDESRYLSELYDSCSRNNVVLSALSKTSSLFTDNGNLLSVVLDSISTLPYWYYHPIVKISSPSHKAEMFFAKFHEKSKHIFRFEVFNEQKTRAEGAINDLACNCLDPIFIGYPYGLVEADRVARVGNNEKESLKTMFLVKLKNKNIEKYVSSVNAHEILDRISF